MTSNRSAAQAATFAALYGTPKDKQFKLRPYQEKAREAILALGDRVMIPPLRHGKWSLGLHQNDMLMHQMLTDFETNLNDPDNWARTLIEVDSCPPDLFPHHSRFSSTPEYYNVPPKKSIVYYHVQSALMDWFPQ